VRDRLARWWHAAEPAPPLSWRDVLAHAGRGVVKLLPLYALAVAWQYTSVGRPGAVLVLGGGVALLLALLAGVLGALERKYVAAVAFGLTIAVLGQLGPFVVGLGAPRGYVASASLALVVVCALGSVVGYAEVRRLQTGGLDQ
jgi:hypothetical protein